MRVVMAPQLSADLNPYQELLRKGIEQADPGIECRGWSGLSLRWLVEGRKAIDILHIHWIEHLYASHSEYRTLRQFIVMALALGYAKLARQPIVYTVHNLAQHTRVHPILNRLANRLVFLLADAIHVHDEAGRSGVEAGFGRRERVYVIPHGNYIGAYPNEVGRGEARNLLGISGEGFVYLCLGQIRPNKGLEGLINAFSALESQTERLIIAGWAPDASYRESIRQLSENDPMVTVHLRLVPGDEIQHYFNACDVCVLPYKTVTTSGAALLAFSFGKPIIAPNIGCFPELVGDDRGILYDQQQTGSLAAALDLARRQDVEKAGTEALAYARRLNWTSIGGQHASVYREMLAAGKRMENPDFGIGGDKWSQVR